MQRHRYLGALAALACLSALTACGNDIQGAGQSGRNQDDPKPAQKADWNAGGRVQIPAPSASDGKGKRIGFFGFGKDNPWSQYMFEAIKDEAAKYGATATFVGPPTFDGTVESQEITDASASKAFDAILVVPIDGPSLAPAVSDAVAAGIKVVSLDFPVGPNTLSTALQVKGMVSQVMENLPDNARTMAQGVINSCASTNPCQVDVLWGSRALAFDKVKPTYFRDALAGHPNIKIVCETDAAYTQDLGRTQAADCASAHPGLNVIASQADESTRGAEGAIEAAGKTFGLGARDIKLVSAYASTYGVKQVRAGKWVQTSYNRPQSMGRAAVRLSLLALTGKSVPAFVPEEELDGVPTALTRDVLKEHPEVVGQWVG